MCVLYRETNFEAHSTQRRTALCCIDYWFTKVWMGNLGLKWAFTEANRLCSPRCRTVYNPPLERWDHHFAVSLKHVTVTALSFFARIFISLRRRNLSHVQVRLQMAVVSFSLWVMNCSPLRRTEKRKQRKQQQLAKLIKVINTSAILFIVIPELTKFRTNKCLGHLHIFRIPLSRQNSRDRCNT